MTQKQNDIPVDELWDAEDKGGTIDSLLSKAKNLKPQDFSFQSIVNIFTHFNPEKVIGGKITLRNILFLLLISLSIIYLHSKINDEHLKINDLNNEIKELRFEATTISSDLMHMNKQSEVLRRIKENNIDLKELTAPPRIIEND